ncbi:MAG: 2TM domain-containing protein [Saprospiraceae bacterium]|nr:2TM domain-containing protein [Saprospiraceae bacterium]
MKKRDPYKLARRRVIRKKRFYQHLTVYIAVALFLFGLNAIPFFFNWLNYYPGMSLEEIMRQAYYYPNWWFQYPAMSWGLAILLHYSAVFGIPVIGNLDEKWEKRTMEQELKRLNAKELNAKDSSKKVSEDKLTLKELQKVKLQELDDSELV